MKLKINGEEIMASKEVIESLLSNKEVIIKQRKYSNMVEVVKGAFTMFGITVRATTSELTARAKGVIDAEVAATPTLFYYLSDGNYLSISDGLNDGSSRYKDRECKELRLNNVYGSGDIYHRLVIFNVPSWVRVGRYDLRSGYEEIMLNDEDALLSIQTHPHIVQRLLRV